MASSFKKDLELLTDIDMLLMVEKRIREEICHAIHRFGKINNKYLKDCDKNKESSYLKYWDVNNLYGWAMSQKLIAAFHMQEPGNYSICLLGQKFLATMFVMKT